MVDWDGEGEGERGSESTQKQLSYLLQNILDVLLNIQPSKQIHAHTHRFCHKNKAKKNRKNAKQIPLTFNVI